MAYDERGRLALSVLSEHGRHVFSTKWLEDGKLLAQGIAGIYADVYDGVAVQEVLTVQTTTATHLVVVQDGVTVSEDLTLVRGIFTSVSDGVTVSEVAQVSLSTLNFECHSDLIVVDSSVNISIGTGAYGFDNVYVDEYFLFGVTPIPFLVFDGLLITEHADVLDLMVEVGVVVSYASVIDWTYAVLDVLNPSVGESILQVLEWGYQSLDVLNIEPIDSVVASDHTVVEPLIDVNVYDDILAISEDILWDVAWALDMGESVVINENLAMFLYAVPIRKRLLVSQVRAIGLKPIQRQVMLYPREGVYVP